VFDVLETAFDDDGGVDGVVEVLIERSKVGGVEGLATAVFGDAWAESGGVDVRTSILNDL
jgi:hypothetical protein